MEVATGSGAEEERERGEREERLLSNNLTGNAQSPEHCVGQWWVGNSALRRARTRIGCDWPAKRGESKVKSPFGRLS